MPDTFDRLDMLWERYPRYHEKTVFTDLEQLLAEHASFQADFEGLEEDYKAERCDEFLIQLALSDLPYRYATKEIIESCGLPEENRYVNAFMEQFADIDTDQNACFLFPESYVSQFFVITEVCSRAKQFRAINNLFPDEDKVHYLAVFDKENMDDVLLMYHLLYTNTSQDLFGGYSLYDYSLSWYQTHLRQNDTVLRSPYLPDRTAVYLGALPYHLNPAKAVYVRRNIRHILECGYFASELDLFLNLTTRIMPVFQWWYKDIALYEEKDGYKTNWKLERTKIRTALTEQGVIKPKWKHELSLFHAVRRRYPDTLCQYRPEWLGTQSLDIYIPSLRTAIEYQGIQHYRPVPFFGGEEALITRWELDRKKQKLCEENRVQLVEWPYDLEPSDRNVRITLDRLKEKKDPKLEAFLDLADFDAYMERYPEFCGLRMGGATFMKEQQLMESDEKRTHRQKELEREKRKKEILDDLHAQIGSLVQQAMTDGIWDTVRGRGKIEYRYHYPDGKRGDIEHYLAGRYDEPVQTGENAYVIRIRRSDYPLIELLVMSGRNLFNQYDHGHPEPAAQFLMQYNRIAKIEYLMYQVNYYREEYRSLRSIEEPELKKLLQDYHRDLNSKTNRIYEYLIGDGKTHAKWKSEQKAYAIVLKHYPDAQFQYQPDFLFGQRLDIYIPSADTAIEYQGKQHYEPVAFFGGLEGHKRNRERDERKFRRCRAHGITVLYWDYDRPLTEEYFLSEIKPQIGLKTDSILI
ncbi:MAG: hypothetical protein K6G61_04635 [Solobacterium sp.]|nr:hypothetical protein [Solobacterium sp.]